MTAPFFQTEWPSAPVTRPRDQDFHTTAYMPAPVVLSTLLARNPYYVQLQPKRNYFTFDPPNTLILGIPAVAVSVQITRDPYYVQLQPKRNYFTFDPPNTLILGIPPLPVPSNRPPFAQYEWPGPQQKQRTRVDILPNTLILGIPPKPPAAARPFAQYSWPSPPVRKRAVFVEPPPNTLLRGIPGPCPIWRWSSGSISFDGTYFRFDGSNCGPPVPPPTPPATLIFEVEGFRANDMTGVVTASSMQGVMLASMINGYFRKDS